MRDGATGQPVPVPRMILFLVGSRANSLRARQNLSQFCEQELGDGYDLEVVDVLKDYRRALEHNVVVAPALEISHTDEPILVLGDLSDSEALRSALLKRGSGER